MASGRHRGGTSSSAAAPGTAGGSPGSVPPGTYTYLATRDEGGAQRAPLVARAPAADGQHLVLSIPLDWVADETLVDDGVIRLAHVRWSIDPQHVDDCDWSPDVIVFAPAESSWSNDATCNPSGPGSEGGTMHLVENASVKGLQDVVVEGVTMHGTAIHIEGQTTRVSGSQTMESDYTKDIVVRADGLLLKSTEQDRTSLSWTTRTIPVVAKTLTLWAAP
jgi:hypothetical protein